MKTPNPISDKTKTVIFDLDGTLIDSAQSILAGLEYAIHKNGLNITLPLSSSLVGPTLEEIWGMLTQKQELNFNVFEYSFKEHYDLGGYKLAKAYPGVEDMLTQLREAKLTLHLATNKRFAPTRKILEFFGWSQLFNQVYSIDQPIIGPFKNKAQMIEALLKNELINVGQAVYVGDRVEDQESSLVNGLETILVNWGYGGLKLRDITNVKRASSSKELLQVILERA